MTTSYLSTNINAAQLSDSSMVQVCELVGNTKFISTNYQQVLQKIIQSYLNYESELDISSYKVSPSYAMSLHLSAIKTTPELSYIDNSITYSTAKEQGQTYLVKLKPHYIYSKEQAKKIIQEYHSAADFYLNQVKDNLSVCNDDFSKALLLHDELILENRYQLSGSSPYTLMVKHFGKCEDYTRTYAYLLGQLGIHTEIISSQNMNHEWLRAKLDGKYYNIDVTWDDPTPDKPGFANHDYFLLSDSANYNHYGFCCINSTDKKYDNSRFHSYISKMCKVNSTEKAVYATDSTNKKIVKYNYVTNAAQTIIDLKDSVWSAGGRAIWPGIYTGLDMYNGILYYNTADAIYAYNPNNKTINKVSGNSYSYQYYGLRIRNGKLYGVTAASPNVSGNEVFIKSLVPNNPTSIKLNKTSLTLVKGSSETLTASIAPANADNKTVTWTSSNTKTVTVNNGKITAVSAGTANITAKTSNGKTAVCQVTVKNPQIAVSGVSLNKASLCLGKGESFVLKSDILPSNATNKTVTWTTSNNKVAVVSGEKVTAKENGTAVITVKTNNGKTAKCTVTVQKAPSSVTLSKNTVTLGVGESFSLSSSVNYGSACAVCTYQTNNSSILKMTSTEVTGSFKALKTGTAYVTVKTYNGKQAVCKVIVKSAPTWISMDKKSITMKVGQTASVSSYIASNAGCATKTYRSSDSSIVKMTKTDETGEFKALKAGTAYVVVRTYNGKEATCKITVKR